MLMLSERDVAQLLSTAEAIELLEQQLKLQLRGEAQSVPRRRARTGAYILHVLPAATEGPELGAKIYLSGGTAYQPVYLLFGESGLEAMIAADRLGRIRTGAASGLATKYLARPNARCLTLFGAGGQARYQVEAVCAVRPIEQLVICARNTTAAQVLAADLGEFIRANITVTSDAANAIADADVICTMTSAKEPLFDGRGLPTRVHVNAAGSNRATHREIDRVTLDRASTIVVDDVDQARLEAGDFLLNGNFDWARLEPMSTIFDHTIPPHEGITIFESLGIGLWDLALAVELLQRARAQGLGHKVELADFFQAP